MRIYNLVFDTVHTFRLTPFRFLKHSVMFNFSVCWAAFLSIIFGIICMCGNPRITDTLSYEMTVFYGCTITAVIFMCAVFIMTFLVCCLKELSPLLQFVLTVLAGLAFILYIPALVFLTRDNCCTATYSQPRSAWLFGAMLAALFAFVKAIFSQVWKSRKSEE
ncbi:unnamed protein product [Calicophoron daubneyi]|uniref:MARVEL domain-containing protein n=1 Tax=Calicophoron daubneyi TaxID=300641 RepID=A0AAV2TCM4_CALDB